MNNCLLLMNTHIRFNYIEATLALLKHQPVDILIVDSGDRSCDEWNRIMENNIKPFYEVIQPETDIWTLHRNWNIGIEKALQRGYKYICLTDEGILPSWNFFEQIISLMERHPEFGLVGPIHNAGVPQQMPLLADLPLFDDIAFCVKLSDPLNLEAFSKDLQKRTNKTEYEWRTVSDVESHLRVIRSEIFIKLKEKQGFYLQPEAHFGFYFDSYLCLQVRELNYKIAVCQRSFLWHYRDLFYGLQKKLENVDFDVKLYSEKIGDTAQLARKLKEGFVEEKGNSLESLSK